MLTYKAMYKFCDDGVHAEVLDFPGAISCGDSLDDARKCLAGALVDMANAHFTSGQLLPQPDPLSTDTDADLLEPIDLIAAYVTNNQANSGVDISLIKRNLGLTVTERWQENQRALEFTTSLQEAGRVQRGRGA